MDGVLFLKEEKSMKRMIGVWMVGLLLFSTMVSAVDFNAVAIQGNVASMSWTEEVIGGVVVRHSHFLTLWSYDPHPQLLTYNCLGPLAGTKCLAPGLMDCALQPLSVVQLLPPAAYPIQATRRCVDTSPGGGGCVQLYGYWNSSSNTAESNNANDIILMPRGNCTAK